MPPILNVIIAVIVAYLIGSIPVGMFIVRALTGRDIREVGSGRTGGTNAFRAGGLSAGLLTAFGDILKGYTAVQVGRLIGGTEQPAVEALCAIVAVAGHNWPIYLKFKGGAGTGPNVGAATALWPPTFLVLVPITALALYGLGYASVASTLASVLIIVIFLVRFATLGEPLAYVGYAVATALLTAIALIPNYKRLVAGTERRIGPRSRARQPAGPSKIE
jgi:acyl phosphate:glycerol-3-phosphate acyltransferase